MLNIFRWIVCNRFCCGWLAALFFVSIAIMFELCKWWQLFPIVTIIYTGFRYAAFKYLDE